jgi:CheY-like chemotaxis protein
MHPNPAPLPVVLLADQDRDTRALYREWLAQSGWDVDEAQDGREALAKAIGHRPALLITETRLPFIDGYVLCQLLRSDVLTCDVPILVVTGDAYPADVRRARAVGADAVLVKPCLPEEVVREAQLLRDRSKELRHRAETARARAGEQIERSARLVAVPAPRQRRMHVRAHERFVTTTPPADPPELRCPSCDAALKYERSHIGGVSFQQPEQWDYFVCVTLCGTFQYRHRTRKLRRVP